MDVEGGMYPPVGFGLCVGLGTLNGWRYVEGLSILSSLATGPIGLLRQLIDPRNLISLSVCRIQVWSFRMREDFDLLVKFDLSVDLSFIWSDSKFASDRRWIAGVRRGGHTNHPSGLGSSLIDDIGNTNDFPSSSYMYILFFSIFKYASPSQVSSLTSAEYRAERNQVTYYAVIQNKE